MGFSDCHWGLRHDLQGHRTLVLQDTHNSCVLTLLEVALSTNSFCVGISFQIFKCLVLGHSSSGA